MAKHKLEGKIVNEIIAEHGETGNKHVLKAKNGGQILVNKFDDTRGVIAAGQITGQVELVHEEHKAITILEGEMEKWRELSYNVFSDTIKEVSD